MEYKPVIGLEVHVELLTDTKLFCGCSTQHGAQPNTQVCPVCLGLPGALPVLSSMAVRQAVAAALALGCTVNKRSVFARKNYFYPDLPKGYQITQDVFPLAVEGVLEIDFESRIREISIARLHIEEDSGKLTHASDSTLIDYNRSGSPLAEIVTTPCLTSPSEAKAFLEALKQVLQYAGVSDCKMEEGSLRCDANISLQVNGEPGERTEIKNLNSFRAVERALAYEIRRHQQLLAQGGQVQRQTLRWDEDRERTFPMRIKEQALDYRYFPEPDLPPLILSADQIDNFQQKLPELPRIMKMRLVRDYNISEYDADVLTRTRAMAVWFEAAVKAGAPAKEATNWLTGEVAKLLNREGISITELPFSHNQFARLLELLSQGEISGPGAKQVLGMLKGKDPEQIIEEQGLAQISDKDELEALVDTVVSQNLESVKDYLAGKEKALGFIMGQAMARTRGRANPMLLKEILIRKLDRITEK